MHSALEAIPVSIYIFQVTEVVKSASSWLFYYQKQFFDMKKLIQNTSIALCLLVGLLMYSCGGNNNSNNASSTEPHGENAAYTSAYICPMHCKDSGSEKAGTCPVCGMDYVKLDEHTKDGHKH